MRVSREDFESTVESGMSYAAAARHLGVTKSAVSRAAVKYRSRPAEVSAEDDPREVMRLRAELLTERQKVADLMRATRRGITVVDAPSNRFLVGLISDTHYGSLYHHESALRSFCEHCAERGATEILHAGDVLEGEKMHFGQDRELSTHGLTHQLAEMREKFPRDLGLTVRFITGNHDIAYRKACGVEIGPAIAYEMGWEYLGDCYGEVEYRTQDGGRYTIALLHPGGGTAYAVSYRMQKIIEQWEGGRKPDCLVAGHFHKSMWLPQYRNVSGIHPGCFQRQTPFMASKSSAAHVAGWIIEVAVGDEWKSVKAECVSFY